MFLLNGACHLVAFAGTTIPSWYCVLLSSMWNSLKTRYLQIKSAGARTTNELHWLNLKIGLKNWDNSPIMGHQGNIHYYQYKVKCCYNTVQFITILHTALQWQWQKVYQILESQQTPHTSPSRVSYGVSIVRIWEEIDRLITEPHCTMKSNG